MRVLVTGGAGFIGSHLVDALLAEGARVTVLDDLSQGNEANVAHHEGNPDFEFMQGDVTDAALVRRLTSDCHVVYHLAAVVGVHYVLTDPLRTIHVNVTGTEVVLRAAYETGCRVVVASSSEVYGKNDAVPLTEDAPSVFGPTTATRWCYALAKALDEHLALAYHKRGLEVSIVRYFNAYGPRLDPRGYGSVIARFITQALRGEPITVYGDGNQTRSFTYVADTARGTILAGTVPEAVGKVFNIGNDREVTILELAGMVKKLTASNSPIVFVPYEKAYGPHFEETRRRIPDTARAREILGFEAAIPLEEGLSRTIRWFEAEGLARMPS